MHAGISGVCGRIYSNTEYEDAFIVVLTAPTLPLTSRWLMCHHAARVCYTHTHTQTYTNTHTHTHTHTMCPHTATYAQGSAICVGILPYM